ncbi:MAG TPA: hypothetical protein VLA46_09765 [Saprospiraceae bacterium]|nr:hypothetical protein [Saprospiraceae bacterium]
MIKATKILTVVMAVILMSSFTNKNASEFIGTYSVSETDPAHITLTINADQTFTYQDFSSPENKIDVRGNWTLKGQKVILQDNTSRMKFHDVWSFDNHGQVAKSRKGLSFYRLCKMDG